MRSVRNDDHLLRLAGMRKELLTFDEWNDLIRRAMGDEERGVDLADDRNRFELVFHQQADGKPPINQACNIHGRGESRFKCERGNGPLSSELHRDATA